MFDSNTRLLIPSRPQKWVPAHCGLPGNETADRLAKEASSLPQDDVHVDVRTITRAVGRSASKAWRRSWNDSLFRRIMEDRMPSPVQESRDDAVNVHQLRAGHWGRASSYLHRIGRNPSHACRQCSVPGARRHSAWCAARARTRRSTCSWSAPAWLACASAFSATLDPGRRSCGTAGPWRPWHGSAAHLRVLIGCYPQHHGLRVAPERVTLDNGLNEAL